MKVLIYKLLYCYFTSARTILSEVVVSIFEASAVKPQPFFEDPQEIQNSNTKVIAIKEGINFFILNRGFIIFNDEIYKIFYELSLSNV